MKLEQNDNSKAEGSGEAVDIILQVRGIVTGSGFAVITNAVLEGIWRLFIPRRRMRNTTHFIWLKGSCRRCLERVGKVTIH